MQPMQLHREGHRRNRINLDERSPLVSNLRRDNCFWPLDHYLLHRSGVAYSLMKILPVDRALSIYGALADRSETYIEGEKDKHRPAVEGLSYLRKLDREIDSRS